MNQTIAPSAVPTETPHPVTFTGVRGDFLRLVSRGAMLELVTLGFYRFWLATDMRRHLWSHTSVGGDAPEYTGTAKELLIGFLFALAILVPIYLIYFFIGLEAERVKAFASIPLILFFYLFYQFAMYRARRYRLTRTIWRGVRFWMKGSGWAYAGIVALWSLLVVVTLGLALPWYQAAIERYKMRHSFYGDLPGRFDATGGSLFARYIWFWLGAVVLVVAVSAVSAVDQVVGPILGVLLVIAWPFAFAAYKAIEWRWWVSGIRFGDVRFESKLRATALFGLYWKVIGWSILIFFLLSIWVGAVTYSMVAATSKGQMTPEAFAAIFQSAPTLITMAVGYLIAALAFGTVVRMYLRHDIWARVAASAVVYNLAAADNVSARGDAVNALGEGFADSFDIGGF
jgi:uncharacterized membrane protein YjgN (DUF898 family)